MTRIIQVFVSAMLAALILLGAAPQPAVCMLTSQTTAACKMACCKTAVPGASCPLMRPAAPRDEIGLSTAPTLQPTTQAVSLVANKLILVSWRQIESLRLTSGGHRPILDTSPHIGPAPPSPLA